MDISFLPDHVFLNISRHLSLRDVVRLGRVNKSFYQKYQLAISQTKLLEWNSDGIKHGIELECGMKWDGTVKKMIASNLEGVLSLCANSLERIVIQRPTDYFPFYVFSRFSFPSLIEVDIKEKSSRGIHVFDNDTLAALIRNSPNLKSLSRRYFRVFPNVVCERLEKLALYDVEDTDSANSLVGKFPNLKEFKANVDVYVDLTAMDGFFRQTPNLKSLDLWINQGFITLSDSTHFWQLSSLTKLRIYCRFYTENKLGDSDLKKIGACFPQLQELDLYELAETTKSGIVALASLKDLRKLVLTFTDDANIAGLRRFADCEYLQHISITGGTLNPDGFVSVVRFYSGSVTLDRTRITQVDTPEKAIDILVSFFGLGQRNIKVTLRSPKYNEMEKPGIWQVETVRKVLEELEQQGVVIKIFSRKR